MKGEPPLSPENLHVPVGFLVSADGIFVFFGVEG